MRRHVRYLVHVTLFALIAVWLYPATGMSDEVTRITKEELKQMLGKPEVVVIDVRKEKDWKTSDIRIPGATWEDFQDVEKWAPKYPKEKTIVLYCT